MLRTKGRKRVDVYCRIASALAVASALDCFAQSPPPEREAQPRPNLSGRWRLDPEKSENARDKIQQARETARSAGTTEDGAGPRGRPGSRGGSGRGPGNPSESSPAGRPDIEKFLSAPSQVAITHTDSVITILEKDGRVRVLQLDAQPHASEAGAAQVTSRWNGNQLVVETVRSGAPRVTETFELDGDRSQLTITTRLEGRPAVSVRRLYEPEADAAPQLRFPERSS